jgi:hypothetical protein
VLCPRCDKEEAVKVFEAPKDRSWEIFRCQNCNFVWRSTEKEEITNGNRYHPNFKLTEDAIRNMEIKPAIPPLLRKTDGSK